MIHILEKRALEDMVGQVRFLSKLCQWRWVHLSHVSIIKVIDFSTLEITNALYIYIFTASIGSVDSLCPSVFISCLNLHQFLILCSSKAMMFVKLYFRTSDICLISAS